MSETHTCRAEDEYEAYKRLVCALVDLAKERGLPPHVFVYLTALEASTNVLALTIAEKAGPEALADWARTCQELAPRGIWSATPEDIRARAETLLREAQRLLKEVASRAREQGQHV